jgi:O-antigen ligase
MIIILSIEGIRQLRARNFVAPVAFFLFIGLLITFLYFKNYTFKDRIDSLFSVKTEGSISQRQQIWQSASSLFIKNWPIGVGTGDSKIELIKEYELDKYDGEYYNAHNEYLQTGISVGFIGWIILVLNFCMPFLTKPFNALHICFVLLFALSCLTESMLSTQKGVVFYALFQSLFVLSRNSTESNVTVFNK